MADREDSRAKAPLSMRQSQLLIGRLESHGAANYWFKREEERSYYVRILTSSGRKTIWGKDLERALHESKSGAAVGDQVGVRRVNREAVTVNVPTRDASGQVIGEQSKIAQRTRWAVEKVEYFAERARLARQLRDEQTDVRAAVRAHPELRSAFLSVRAAEEFAAQRIADPRDRERFLDLVRGAIGGSIRKGEPLPAIRLKEPSAPRARLAADKAKESRSR